MRRLVTVLVSIFFLGLAWPLAAQENTSPQPEIRSIIIKRAQISGLSDEVVTVVYTEGKRKVYDPVLITPETEIWWGKKTVTPASLRRLHYIKVTGGRQNEIIIAQRIDILTAAPVVKKTAVKQPTAKIPAKAIVKKPVQAAGEKKQPK
ncbi:MAG: hypothetical protein HY974_02485 [Candidatus Kerfeldbacteria bacterium]|nr:hypothetical protein [Candidatus Kerfeldbacteria bacterium]